MPNDISLIFFVLIFLFVFIVVALLFFTYFSDSQTEDKRVRDHLTNIKNEFKPEINISLIRQKYLKSLSPFEQAMEGLPGMMKLESLIEQSGKFFPAYKLALTCINLGFIGALATWTYTQQPMAVIPAFFIIFWIPIFVLTMVREKRLAKFEEQLPDALEIMVRAMRSGHRFTDTLNLIARDLPDPISSEFGITFDELSYGIDTRLAFQNLLSRVPSVSLMAMVTSVLVQKESGGNLTEILQNISTVIRGRFKFQRKVKTLTAESKSSVWVLAVLPFGIFAMLKITTPNYVDVLFTDPNGIKMIAVGLGLMVVGVIWIQKLTQIRV